MIVCEMGYILASHLHLGLHEYHVMLCYNCGVVIGIGSGWGLWCGYHKGLGLCSWEDCE